MPRSLTSLSVALSLGVTLAFAAMGCTEPGLPWGILDATIEARFEPTEGRLDEEGRFKTAANYALQLEQISLRFDALTLVLAGAGAADFDPANPPEGYSLCHNGHCHSASGALVDYEDIALELAGGSAGSRVSIALDPTEVEVVASPGLVSLQPCDPSPCALPMGELAGAELVLSSLTLSGRAFDQLTGDKARLGPEGEAFEVTISGPQTILAQIEGSVGPGEPVGVLADVSFPLPLQLFDAVDFGAEEPLDASDWQSHITHAISEHGSLEVTINRFD